MIDTLKIFDELKETMETSAARKIAEVIGTVYEELKNTVTKVEFNELKDVVKELVEAQKRTELRLEELAEAQRSTEQRVGELAEAQQRTEERLTRIEVVILELTEVQKRSEERLTRVEVVIHELTEAQKRGEERLTRVEMVMQELAEAQKRTEVEVRELAVAHKETRRMLGGLSDAVGYGLEDRAIKSLPALLKSRYGIDVSSPLVRKFVRYNGRRDEINIYGTGEKEKMTLYIIGEAKARLAKKHIDDFLKLVGRLESNAIITRERFLLVVTYSVEPEIEEYARDKGVEVIWSFEV